MERWWWRMRHTVRSIVFPLICLQFLRTLIFPTWIDVLLLFVLFIVLLGLLLNVF
ncbi:hypothetical protein MH117_22540 [Paenibacillus sp. ACRRX]|uniref:hypothetical protein n=1 Tax=unclassified Paenibacillus TaxID=185978 RepID=UPI001EF54E6D|nr:MULTISPECIES: hypothetical protein [unclassified Paenibacillus]MCG7410196.1 hypothetical protein [Paenibacillus sp. ACRRX]MDK8183779.1 hypothetical protein [Paenibacillus sp. UMB4589-SE434]